jgi:antirestriction protein ArdC
MMGDALSIGHNPGQHASYVASWIAILRNDPKEILRASRDAEQIHRYVMALEKGRALPEQSADSKPAVDEPEPEKAVQRVASRGR